MEGPSERKRKPKFTREENEALVASYSKNAVALGKKFGPGNTHAKKNKIWEEIAGAVNAVGFTPRTVQDCQNRWKEQKKSSKEKVVRNRKDVVKTGGGPPPADLDPLDAMAAATIGESALSGIPGGGLEIGGVGKEENVPNDELQSIPSPTPLPSTSITNYEESVSWTIVEDSVETIAKCDVATQTVQTGQDSMAALLAQGERQIAVQTRLTTAIEELVRHFVNQTPQH